MPYQSHNRIADLLLEQGAARARGEQQAGQAWGQAIQGIGDTASRTITSLLDQKVNEPVRAAQRQTALLQAAAVKNEATGAAKEKAILPMALKPNDAGVLTYDRDLLTREFAAANIADRLPDVLKGLDTADAAALSLKTVKGEGLAGLAYGVLKSGSTPQSFNLALEHAVANGFTTKAEAAQIVRSVGDDPARIAEVATSIAGSSKAFAGLLEESRANQARETQAAATAKQAAANLEADNARADAALAATNAHNADTTRIAQQNANANTLRAQRPPAGATVVVQTVDANGNPITKIVPKVAGSEFSSPPTTTQRANLSENEAVLTGLTRIGTLAPPEKLKTWIGPVQGRANAAKLTMPGVAVDQDMAEFFSEVSAVKNRMIRAITGAQMSEVEARRIMSQLPDVTLKPEVFAARMAATKRNLEAINKAIKPNGTAPAAGAPRQYYDANGNPITK